MPRHTKKLLVSMTGEWQNGKMLIEKVFPQKLLLISSLAAYYVVYYS